MVFVSICTALYDYVPQGDNELELQEGDLVYILEKTTEDDWWKAKKKARPDEDQEPTGLIPNNYVDEVCFRLSSLIPLAFHMLTCNHEGLSADTRCLRPDHLIMPKHSMTMIVRPTKSCPLPKTPSLKSMTLPTRTGHWLD